MEEPPGVSAWCVTKAGILVPSLKLHPEEQIVSSEVALEMDFHLAFFQEKLSIPAPSLQPPSTGPCFP